MPNRDGTGPRGDGSGRGMGGGRGMGQNRLGAGPGGFCVCTSCGEKIRHIAGTPCSNTACPKCGAKMMREKLDDIKSK